MRNRTRLAIAAAAVTVSGPLLAAVAPPASAATKPGCPTTTGDRHTQTPATYPKTVALTFDDGPHPTWTPKMLAVLAEHHVHATFFVIGRRAEAYPEVLQQIVEAGHVLGNHTWAHPTAGRGLYDLTTAELVTEFDPTTALIKGVTGRPVCFFRAPQGRDDAPAIRKLARDRNQMVTGFHTASDYLQPRKIDPAWTARIERRLEDRGAHPILLMHDGGAFRGNSVEALDEVITWYASRGYVFTDPAGRPFPGDLPPGAKVTPTGWAVQPGWTPPSDGLAEPRPTDLPPFTTSSDVPTTSGTTTSAEPVPGHPTRGDASPTKAPPGRPPTTRDRPLARLAENSAKDPLAARKLTDAVARYLMVFSSPPA
jgi:peptidoglycan/xylan/chitin deacetylase (PgdA/CDA1 family)